jgi:hypothetical protein
MIDRDLALDTPFATAEQGDEGVRFQEEVVVGWEAVVPAVVDVEVVLRHFHLSCYKSSRYGSFVGKVFSLLVVSYG